VRELDEEAGTAQTSAKRTAKWFATRSDSLAFVDAKKSARSSTKRAADRFSTWIGSKNGALRQTALLFVRREDSVEPLPRSVLSKRETKKAGLRYATRCRSRRLRRSPLLSMFACRKEATTQPEFIAPSST
jgi:hypothetical protein